MAIYILKSPEKRVTVTLFLENGSLFYQIVKDGFEAVARSPLGLVTEKTDFSCGLKFKNEIRNYIDVTYKIPAFKKEECIDRANCIALTLEKNGEEIVAEARAYDDGGAVRLTLKGAGGVKITEEKTGFAVPAVSRGAYSQKFLFCYEDQYHPVEREDLWQNNWAFPMLVRIGEQSWALYAEAPIFGGTYCGGTLLSTPENPSVLVVQRASDQLSPIDGALPFSTPWRAVVAGDLNAIVSSNLLENLNPPSIVDDTEWIKAGRVAWSWMSEKGSDQCIKAQKRWVDYAQAMGYEYSCVDARWPGNVDIAELVEYAKPKNVGIWIWAHSEEMRDPAEAQEKMKLWSSWGVKGLKIDFFESDSQERIGQYKMLSELAAKYKLLLNYHGCTKPTGSSRVWPHVLNYEGVQGAEYLGGPPGGLSTFLPTGPDAAHHCTLPFTRNAVGPMDYTPVILASRRTGTTDAHQCALTVIFTGYAQHIAEHENVIQAHLFKPLLMAVPADWDETIVLEGMPGSFVTMARRKGDTWFVAGICARHPRNVKVKLDFLNSKPRYSAELYADDLSTSRVFDQAVGALPPPDEKLCADMMCQRVRKCIHQHDIHAVRVEKTEVKKGDYFEVPMSVNGGFTLHLSPIAVRK